VVQARRAKPRRSRVMVSLIVVAVALLAGGAVAVLLFWPDSLTATVKTPTPRSTVADSSPAPTAQATPTPTAPPSATASLSVKPGATATTASRVAISALNACRDRVKAADEVLEQARTGVRHWEAHVGAEREAAEGSISIAKRQKIFKETRQQGPGDQNRYANALRAYDKVKDASCGKTEGADADVAATLARCQQRVAAQRPVLRTAAAAMGDWKQHLADMQRSAVEHNRDAQQVWIEAYKAAPPNINAYNRAAREFKKASKC
jgi:hypothetical protein